MRAVFLLLLLAFPASAGLNPDAGDTIFQTVVVKQGDTLWGIANQFLKDPAKWDEILKYNKLPSDPTVALPGMTLRVPIRLIKENLRAAHLIYVVNRVLFRRKETADWRAAALEMELYKGDSIRTLESAKAKVRFLNADLLSLDPNSLAIIKPQIKDADVELKTGGVFVGRARVVTASARVSPKTPDTQYSAKVRHDLSTLVEVYTGVATVEGQGRTVDVPAGMSTEVNLGMAPGIPAKIIDLPEFEARAAEFTGATVQGQARVRVTGSAALPVGAIAEDVNRAQDVAMLRGDAMSLAIGIPISGYRVQASRTRDFDKILFDKVFEAEERFDPRQTNLPPGVYWFRIALIDLLGTENKPSAARLYSIGLGGATRHGAADLRDLKEAVVLSRPTRDEDVFTDTYRVQGLVKNEDVTVAVNGRPVRLDENGNFIVDLRLREGANDVNVVVTDRDGNTTSISRRLTFYWRPP